MDTIKYYLGDGIVWVGGFVFALGIESGREVVTVTVVVQKTYKL